MAYRSIISASTLPLLLLALVASACALVRPRLVGEIGEAAASRKPRRFCAEVAENLNPAEWAGRAHTGGPPRTQPGGTGHHRDEELRDILDAGCGFGRDALAFAKPGYSVTAFDAFPTLVALAEQHIGQQPAAAQLGLAESRDQQLQGIGIQAGDVLGRDVEQWVFGQGQARLRRHESRQSRARPPLNGLASQGLPSGAVIVGRRPCTLGCDHACQRR